MNTIINRYEYTILQNRQKPTIYTISFEKNNEKLINSIVKTKILLGVTVYDNYTSVSFNATSVYTFKQFQNYLKQNNGVANMPYDLMLKMISNLSNQLKYLITKQNVTFIGYHPENIIVVDNNKFIYFDEFTNISNELITITCPFTKTDFFMSPELNINTVTHLPYKIHYKSIYYSFAGLIIYCITLQEEYEYFNFKENINNLPIKDTKMFGLLKRCLNDDIKYRCILFI